MKSACAIGTSTTPESKPARKLDVAFFGDQLHPGRVILDVRKTDRAVQQ
jgi:hypothetical protein